MFDRKGSNDEDLVPLCPNDTSTKFSKWSESSVKSAIIKGAGNQLEKWPSYLLFVFLTSCIVMASLLFFVVTTVLFSLPTVKNMEDERPINVYSVRQDGRAWSVIDFCHIENAARENPNLNIHLFNLRKSQHTEDLTKDVVTIKSETETQSVFKSNNQPSRITEPLRKALTQEARLRNLLAHEYKNVKNNDVVVEIFFQGTNLSKVASHLNNETLKIATDAYLIWNSTGIALDPRLYCNLRYISQFMCKKNDEDCIPDELATIDPKNNIQAAGIACQSFVGYFINEISKNESLREVDALTGTIKKFCSKLHPCNEIRILESIQPCALDISNCPIVNQHVTRRNIPNYRYFLPRL